MGLDNLVLLILAVWRVSSLVTAERGPWDVFVRLRARAGIRPDEHGEPESWPDGFVAGVLSCLWCCSVYVGIVAAVAYYLAPVVTVWLCLPFALSAGAIIVERWAHG